VNIKPALPTVFSVTRIPLGAVPLLHLASQLPADSQTSSAMLAGDGWRCNILALNCVLRVEMRHNSGAVHYQDSTIQIGSMADTLQFLHHHETTDDSGEFVGGWIGAFSYEALHQYEDIFSPALNLFQAPQLSFQLTDSYICQNSSSGEMELLLLDTNYSSETVAQRRKFWLDYCDRQIAKYPGLPEYSTMQNGAAESLFHTLEPLLSRQQYINRVVRIKEYIAAGEIYQANFTYPVAALADGEVTGDRIIGQLMLESGCRYGAWLRDGNSEVVSLSPESFLEKRGNQLLTRPIKGTCARHADPVIDLQAKQQLSISVKNRAELSMIVDLERNDLGRVCAPGTVRVNDHAHLLELPALYHLCTEVTGTLSAPVTELLPALFPGGSITGAPKIRAMQIISELEQHQRGVYTGAIGWIGLNGDLEFNVAIRTLQRYREQWYLSTGGGIVYDSDPEEEYRETLHKLYSFSGLQLPEEL